MLLERTLINYRACDVSTAPSQVSSSTHATIKRSSNVAGTQSDVPVYIFYNMTRFYFYQRKIERIVPFQNSQHLCLICILQFTIWCIFILLLMCFSLRLSNYLATIINLDKNWIGAFLAYSMFLFAGFSCDCGWSKDLIDIDRHFSGPVRDCQGTYYSQTILLSGTAGINEYYDSFLDDCLIGGGYVAPFSNKPI